VLAAIEWDKVGEVIWVSALMGVASIVLFAIAIYGGSRSAESRRTGNGSASAYGALGILGFTAFAALVVFAITVILQKS
jgi:hypothetical protein